MPINETRQVLAIKLAIKLGTDLQVDYPQLGERYCAGNESQRKLALEIRENNGYSNYGPIVIEQAVKFALIGNSDTRKGKIYSGLLDKKEYDSHSKIHRVQTRIDNGNMTKKERKGICGLDRETLRQNALESTLSRGETPWSKEEMSFMMRYALLELFKYRGELVYGAIAHEINASLYNSEKVRTRMAVREAFRRIKNSFPKRKDSKGENEGAQSK